MLLLKSFKRKISSRLRFKVLMDILQRTTKKTIPWGEAGMTHINYFHAHIIRERENNDTKLLSGTRREASSWYNFSSAMHVAWIKSSQDTKKSLHATKTKPKSSLTFTDKTFQLSSCTILIIDCCLASLRENKLVKYSWRQKADRKFLLMLNF